MLLAVGADAVDAHVPRAVRWSMHGIVWAHGCSLGRRGVRAWTLAHDALRTLLSYHSSRHSREKRRCYHWDGAM
jgi:hypothetical protein